MSRNVMNAKLIFDPSEWPDHVVRLILAKAESANCSPSEALRMLLNELAEKAGFEPRGNKAA
jgi:hypothetical protein